MENFREFEAGPDPFGRTWHVRFKWLQTAISIRHSDTVDVKFVLESGEEQATKVISLPLAYVADLSKKTDRKMTDAWCSRLAMLHLKSMIETGEDMEKTIVTPATDELARYDAAYRKWAEDQVRTRRGAGGI